MSEDEYRMKLAFYTDMFNDEKSSVAQLIASRRAILAIEETLKAYANSALSQPTTAVPSATASSEPIQAEARVEAVTSLEPKHPAARVQRPSEPDEATVWGK